MVSACSLLTDVSNLAGDGGADATADAPVVDAPVEASPDASSTPYHDMTNAAYWSSFDLTSVSGDERFQGAAFDGRYLYFAPFGDVNYTPGGRVTRFDTTASFTSASSWSTFDTTTVNANAKGFVGAAFDGRYLYLVPCQTDATTRDGVVTRYDTTASFAAPASWSTFDTTSVNPNAKGFIGGTFDGRFLYLVPYYNGNYDGVAARYDTTADFAASSSWSTFDISSVNPKANGFDMAAFDGRYVYYVPLLSVAGIDGVVARYDTASSFASAASWSTLDTTTVDTSAKGFQGVAFDGRYLYLGPYDNGTYDGVVARYDTAGSFTAIASWSTFDTASVNPGARGFNSAAFDGRYVYLGPYDNGDYDGVVARYDTTATFAASASWSTFDATTVNANAKAFEAAAFDGRYVYFVPNGGTVVVRFDARDPPSMPKLPGWNGSFF